MVIDQKMFHVFKDRNVEDQEEEIRDDLLCLQDLYLMDAGVLESKIFVLNEDQKISKKEYVVESD